MLRPRLIALVAGLTLVPLGSVVQPSLASAPAAQAPAAPERAKPAYEATIRITEHGIPHITADDFGSLGYGSGYAAATSSICTLADTLITARGQRSRWFGPTARYDDQVTLEASNLQVDAFVTDLHNRRVVEKLLASNAGPGKQARQMVRGYVAGINKWLRSNKVTDPECKGDKYLKPDATELDLWYGVYLANLLASGGVFLKAIVTASPPSLSDPGLPEIPLKAANVDKEALLEVARAGPGDSVRIERHRDRRRRDLDGQGHVARQPALPVARPLPLHPAAPDHPGQVQRRRRLPDRLARRQHRVERQRRLESHRVDGVPLHAVRVPHGRPRLDVPHPRRPREGRAADREGAGAAAQRLDRHRDGGSLPHRAGLRDRRPRQADVVEPGQLLGDP